MMVSVTKAEYEAIMFCREQVTGAIEGASDENYVKEAYRGYGGNGFLSQEISESRCQAELPGNGKTSGEEITSRS